MGTFGIDFDMGPLKGGSRDDIDSCRTSFDTIAMTGESLMRRLFEICFFYIFLVDQPPLSQVAIPASHGLKPLTGAWVGTIVHGKCVRRPPKYWLPSRRGLTDFLFIFSVFCRESIKNQKPLHTPLPLTIEGILTELISFDFFLVLGFLLHSHASIKNS